MIRKHLLRAAVASSLLLVATANATDDKWHTDLTIYGLFAGMTGDVGVGPLTVDVNMSFDEILDNLEFGAMGKVRVSNDKWSYTLDVIYMGLQASKNRIDVELDQWVLEPSVGYRLNPKVELLAGLRYYNIEGEIRGPGVLANPIIPVTSEDWLDPFVGADITLPLSQEWNFDLRLDVGGFGISSDLAWQAYPSFNWQFGKTSSMQMGYRWVYADYENGSGRERFKYDVLTQGAQVGVTFRF